MYINYTAVHPNEENGHFYFVAMRLGLNCLIKGGQAWEFWARVFLHQEIPYGLDRWHGSEPKMDFFYHIGPDLNGFLFFTAGWVFGKKIYLLKPGQIKSFW
jgi:hypothetical protein